MPGQSARDWSKLRISNGVINFFLYQQDGTKQWMAIRDTVGNRHLVSWMQVHDSPGKKPVEASLS
jgi:hypothetical protein